MWFVGMIAGFALGHLFGGWDAALAGAALGAVAGIAWKQTRPEVLRAAEQVDARLKSVEGKLDHLYRCLEDINTRLSALEKPGKVAESTSATPMTYAAPTLPLPETVAPVMSAALPPAPVVTAMDRRPPEFAEAAMPSGGGAVPPSADTPVAADNPVLRWLLGGNTLVRVGVVVLFFGVAFLLKYAADRDFIPIELRLVGVAAGAIALLIVGWRLREARPGYALMLQGAGVGVLYLTVFAALRLYHLLPAELAFAVLAGIAAFSAALAVLQDSRALAITGAAGGFLAPILASTGSGNHVALFGFYVVLNAGILAVAWYKAWRVLNLVGFAFTFLIGLAWGAKYYRPELFATTEPFLIVFFLMYVAIAVLFALRQAPRLAHYVDGTLVFGTPLVAFGLQTGLVRGMEFGAAWSALALGAFYLVLASVLHARKQETLRLLVESFLALGTGFATLAVPLAFDGRWTSAVWAVEGAAIVWVGVRQNRLLARAFGLLLQLGAGLAFLMDAVTASGGVPVLNSVTLGCVMLSAAGLFCSRYLTVNRARVSEGEYVVARLLFVWGVLWWFGGGLHEIDRHAPAAWGWHPYLLFCAGSCALFGALWRGLDWEDAGWVALGAVPLAAGIAALLPLGPQSQAHPFAHYMFIGWACAFAVHLWALRAREGRGEAGVEWLHAVGVWLLAVLLSWELGWQIDRTVDGRHVWPLIAWALVPGALIALIAARGERLGWPVAAHRQAYLYGGALPLVVFLLLWMVYANFASDGNPAPLPYVPLLNPLDLAQAAALLALATWYVNIRRLNLPEAPLPSELAVLRGLGVLLFIVLNGVLLRSLHHYADVPFRLDAMLRSVLVQAAFSLFWSLLALGAMVVATRRGLRALWVIGAALLGVVVVKLFIVDLANSGTAGRWVSFIGVGLLVIVVGYFAPVPPKPQEKAA
ncbi:MAG: DUF2339 domain-containing protein [Burkholderiales bacterium]